MCSGRRVAAHFCFHAPEKQSSTQEPPWWMDGWIFTTNRAVLNGGQGERVKPWKFLSAECLVFITRFSRKKTLFPRSLWTFVSRKREREREKEFASVFTFNRGTILDRGTPLYIYIHVYIYIIYTYIRSLLSLSLYRGEKKITSE